MVQETAAMDTTTPTEDNLDQMHKARKQIEFYFTDANLPYDKFMWTLHSSDPDHWVPLSTVSSFKRMRDFSTQGNDWLVNAIKLGDFLQVDETGTKIRRTTEVQQPKNQLERSVYAKGFGDEDPAIQGRLEEFFEKYGPINAVRMRRDEKKEFKGSVFTEFVDFETVEKFLNADPKPSWNGEELLIMTKDDYCEMKIKEKGLTGKGANHRRDLINSRKFDAFREMAKPKKDGDKKAEEVKKDVYLDFLGHKLLIKEDEEGNGTIDQEEIPFVKGVTLRFDGCGGDVAWSEIKDPIKERFDGKSPYIKYSRGEDHGFVGFYKPLTEEDIEFVKTTIKTINKHDVTWSPPTEEDEKQFEIERAQAAARSAFSQTRDARTVKRGRGQRRGRGGGGGGRGRGRGSRSNNNSTREKKDASADSAAEPLTGDKRKRTAVEPEGAHDTGIRGNHAPPVIQTTTKKVKNNEGEATPVSAS